MARIWRLNPDLTTITTCTTTNSTSADEREEMDRAGGLVAAEQRATGTETPPSPPATSSGRSATISGARDEDHERVRALLQQAVLRPAGRGRNPQAQVIDDVAPDRTRRELAAPGQMCERKCPPKTPVSR